jgi:hypothetical protein
MRPRDHFVIGVALGGGYRQTGWAIVKQTAGSSGSWTVELQRADVVFLDRLPLNASLPEVIQHMMAPEYLPRVRELDVAGEPEMIVDVADYGPSAMAAFRDAKIGAVQASVRGRDVEADTSDLRSLTIGKIDLFGHTRSLLELGRLGVVPKSLPLADEFAKQLREFELIAHRVNSHEPESWRDAPADDLVRAVALATWWSDKHVYAPPSIRSQWDRTIEEHNKRLAVTIV